MDENQPDEKDILRRHVLEEKLNTDQPEDSDSSEKESSSVFQSFASKSTSEKRTLFHSEEDSLPHLEVKDPATNSLFSSDSVPAQNKSLFAYDRNIFDESDFAPEDQIVNTSSTNNQNVPPSSVQNHSGTSFDDDDNFENEDPDAAFPLFLSFKANDSIKNVSEGVREKYPAPDDIAATRDNESSSSSTLPVNTENPVQVSEIPSEEFDDYSKMLDAMDTPIFKPYSLPPEEEYYDDSPVYDIPQVFEDRNARDNDVNIDGTDMTDPDEAYSPEYDHVPVRSREIRSQMSGDPDPALPTARPGTRYSAAQQMGNVTPAPKIRTQPRQIRAANRMPLVIVLFTLAILVALFSVWSYFSDGNGLFSLFGSKSNTNVTTAAATAAAAVIETAAETTAAATSETTQEPTPVPTNTPAPTQETTAAETTAAETTAATTAETTAAGPAMIPSGFATTITNGSASGDEASFDINFKNSGGNDVSFYDGIEYITITFSTSGATIVDVTSNDFVFTANPDKRNTFIGTPVSKEVVAFRDTRTVTISAKSDGTSIGKYTIKYYVKCYS